MLRLFKKRILTIYHWRLKKFNIKLPSRKKVLSFSKFFKSVFNKITLELELKSRKFRKKEILIPIPVSPWKGTRMGLSLLLKNSQTRIDKKKRHRKHKFLYNLLDEMWDTQNQTSLTSKNVVEFTENVLEHAENFRSTRLFPVKKARRIVYPSRLLEKLENTKKDKKTKKRFSRVAFYKEKEKKRKESSKKKIIALKKLTDGQNYIKYKGKFLSVDLNKLTEAKNLLENLKKQKKALKRRNKKKNSLDFFLYSVFVKAKKKRKIRFLTIKKMMLISLGKKKLLTKKYFIKKVNKQKVFKRKRFFFKRTKNGVHVKKMFIRKERLFPLCHKNKRILLNKKAARVSKNVVEKRKKIR